MTHEACCCLAATKPRLTPHPGRRMIRSTKWIVPTAIIALLPKCPMCLAAYIALATGCSVSISSASHLRTSILAACFCTLAWLIARGIAQAVRRRSQGRPRRPAEA